MAEPDLTAALDRIHSTLGELRADLADLRANTATKADLAGVARNVDIAALGRAVRQLHDEMRVTGAIIIRLDHMWPDLAEQLRAMVQQQLGILDRLRALEEQP